MWPGNKASSSDANVKNATDFQVELRLDLTMPSQTIINVEVLIDIWKLKEHCTLAVRTEVQQIQELQD